MIGKVFVTDYVLEKSIEKNILGDYFSEEINDEIEILLVWNQIINKEYLTQFPKLKAIVRYGVGFDKIDVNAAKEKNLLVCNTPDYAMSEVSDTALAMLLSITRGINIYDNNCRKNFNQWTSNTSIKEIKRSDQINIGVIGAGRIGSEFIKKSSMLGFNVYYFDPYIKYEIKNSKKVNKLNELLDRSDVISIHTPLTEETNAMIDESFLSQMKKGSSIINTARGKIIKSLDLIYEKMLKNQIFCVGLDVLPEEPPKQNLLINSWLNREEISSRIIINPHVSYYSVHSFEECRQKASQNALNILNGNEPINIIYDFRK